MTQASIVPSLITKSTTFQLPKIHDQQIVDMKPSEAVLLPEETHLETLDTRHGESETKEEAIFKQQHSSVSFLEILVTTSQCIL